MVWDGETDSAQMICTIAKEGSGHRKIARGDLRAGAYRTSLRDIRRNGGYGRAEIVRTKACTEAGEDRGRQYRGKGRDDTGAGQK